MVLNVRNGERILKIFSAQADTMTYRAIFVQSDGVRLISCLRLGRKTDVLEQKVDSGVQMDEIIETTAEKLSSIGVHCEVHDLTEIPDLDEQLKAMHSIPFLRSLAMDIESTQRWKI